MREEIVSKYKHQFETHSKKAVQAIDQLNRFVVENGSKIRFNYPESKYELRKLRKKLKNPAKGISVSVRHMPSYGGHVLIRSWPASGLM